uniref:Uncharacterized protein n=1 Tax=Oryza rufipogon TaxID=4529 RepID=A0A0E0PGC3_ORYRU
MRWCGSNIVSRSHFYAVKPSHVWPGAVLVSCLLAVRGKKEMKPLAREVDERGQKFERLRR